VHTDQRIKTVIQKYTEVIEVASAEPTIATISNGHASISNVYLKYAVTTHWNEY